MEKINSKSYPEITYEPFEDIWFSPNEVGTPFSFDVTEDLTANKEKMNIIGNFLDNVENVSKKAVDTFVQILSQPSNQYYETVSYFLEFHRDEFDEEELDELFGIEQAKEISRTQMLRCLNLKRVGSSIDEELNEQIFILDFTFNTELTDEILVVYFNTKEEIVSISHES